jgi:[ribosomal protein S18]-alanine N-acetyltransferase
MTIRTYQTTDYQACIYILQCNTPEWFHPDEEPEFAYYLKHELEDYFVAELEGVVVGCAGLNTKNDTETIILSWGMVHPAFHQQRIGIALLQHRTAYAREQYKAQTLVVRTSQMAFGFFEKQGFVLQEIKKDYWAPGFDCYEMQLPLV